MVTADEVEKSMENERLELPVEAVPHGPGLSLRGGD